MFNVIRYVLVSSLLLAPLVVLRAEWKLDDEAERQILADSKLISAAEINEFHRRFVALCMKDLPQEVTIQYLGAVSTDNGRLKHTSEDTDDLGNGFPLSWHVVRDVVVFEFWLSTRKLPTSVSQCQIGGRTLHVNISFVDEDRDPTARLAALGGSSVKDVLRKLELPVVPLQPKKAQ